MQGRIQQPDRDREVVHGLQNRHEVLLLGDSQLFQGRRFLLPAGGQDHAANDGQAVIGQKHVLGPAQPDPLGTEATGVGGVRSGISVGAYGQMTFADLVGPAQDDVELGRGIGGPKLRLAEHNPPGAAINRDHVAFSHGHVAGDEAGARDPDRFGPHHGGLSPAPGDDGRVAHQPAPGGQDPLGGDHAVHIVG